MDPSVQHFISERINGVHHRQLMVITGAEIWCLNQIEQLINSFISNLAHEPMVLTCNADLPKGVNCPATNNTQFRQHLGREYDIVIYNAWRGIRANALAGLSGTVKKNGLLILLCPQLDSWPTFQDEELEKRISWGKLGKASSSLFVSHLVRLIKADDKVLLLSESGLRGKNQSVDDEDVIATGQMVDQRNVIEQRNIIEQIKKVATGHRKRPLVLTAERGRGKSAALGIALAELMAETPKKVLVTAPQKGSVENLFRHAISICPDISDHVQFCAIDELVLNWPEADMLVVDEAAGIPVVQLKALSEKYHRMVFSTTTNGYEGSGRGFEVRFKPWLMTHRPQGKFATLSLPFRWFTDDCLESFWWQTLHLRPLQSDEKLNGRQLVDKKDGDVIFRKISKAELFEDTDLLNAVFILLVDAHYQTTPDDFVALLDAPDQHLFVLFREKPTTDNILGVLTGVTEGPIDDDKLTLNIVSGQRRLQGHMLPQQLAYGLGQRKFLNYRYFRVIRIAVRSPFRTRGYGSALLAKTVNWCQENNIGLMGSSFGVTDALLRFWQQAEFTPALLGFHRDKATAEFNITVLRTLNDAKDFYSQFQQLQNNLRQLLLFHLTNIYQTLDNKIVAMLLNGMQDTDETITTLNESDRQMLHLFCKGSRSLELSATALQNLVLYKLKDIEKSLPDYELLMDYCLKKLNTKSLVKRHNLEGKKQLQTQLKRQAALLSEND